MLCTNNTEKLLGLKGVSVKNIKQTPEITEIHLEMSAKPHICPCCGKKTNHVHDYREQQIKDIPAFGKHITLMLRKRRYHCPHCGKHFFETNSFLPRDLNPEN